MSDTSLILFVVLGYALFFGLYVFVDYYLPRIAERLVRKVSGADAAPGQFSIGDL